MREVSCAIRMAASYKWAGDTYTSELHYKNAKVMYDMMRKNGGMYIKAGQSVA